MDKGTEKDKDFITSQQEDLIKQRIRSEINQLYKETLELEKQINLLSIEINRQIKQLLEIIVRL